MGRVRYRTQAIIPLLAISLLFSPVRLSACRCDETCRSTTCCRSTDDAPPRCEHCAALESEPRPESPVLAGHCDCQRQMTSSAVGLAASRERGVPDPERSVIHDTREPVAFRAAPGGVLVVGRGPPPLQPPLRVLLCVWRE